MPKIKSALAKSKGDEVIRSHYDEICNVLSRCDETLVQFAGKLYDKRIVTVHTKNAAIRRKGYEGACLLIDAVEMKVKQTPARFEVIVKMMKELEDLQVIGAKMSNKKAGRSVSPSHSSSSSSEEETEPASSTCHAVSQSKVKPSIGVDSLAEGTDSNPKTEYKMTAKPRGVAVIINNRNFTCGMKERTGTDKDVSNLSEVFVLLGFSIKKFDNLTGAQMHKEIEEIANLDHTNYDCLIVSILTHGKNKKLCSTDGDQIPIEDFTKCFNGINCPTLSGKPKIFIIQACRGGNYDYGVESEATDLGEQELKNLVELKYNAISEKALDDQEDLFDNTEDIDGGGGAQTLPIEADFVIAYSTVPGYVSWRDGNGSWFIKAFTNTMRKLAETEHLMDILVEVNRCVAMEFESKKKNKQIPEAVVSLTKTLYFRPGNGGN